MKTKHLEFKTCLQEILVGRCRKNPGYSLRAYAKSLDVSPSALSAMINGKRPITEKMKQRLGASLGLTTFELSKMKSDSTSKLNKNTPEYNKIALDTFALISDWYHFAILELTKINGFKSNANYISKSLGITKTEANVAVERLMRLKLLGEENGIYVDTSEHSGPVTNIFPNQTSIASRKLQKQLINKSIQSLEENSINERDHTAMTMVINKNDINKAKELITQFRRKFCLEMESTQTPNAVYNISIGFFQLNKDEGEIK